MLTGHTVLSNVDHVEVRVGYFVDLLGIAPVYWDNRLVDAGNVFKASEGHVVVYRGLVLHKDDQFAVNYPAYVVVVGLVE